MRRHAGGGERAPGLLAAWGGWCGAHPRPTRAGTGEWAVIGVLKKGRVTHHALPVRVVARGEAERLESAAAASWVAAAASG